ncbi:hypothetical protein PALB_28380 [Pseudoalteromonas luteoviolacea B = ATCC 29581]|nr:hypothetical protein PALB_28380 [Pseudoalteromonas luteoviolacea B = ATCC 29581]
MIVNCELTKNSKIKANPLKCMKLIRAKVRGINLPNGGQRYSIITILNTYADCYAF